MFRLKKWDEPQTFAHNRFNDAHSEPQDILQVWFSGVHADIGGGYPEVQSGLSKYPPIWMIAEAVKCGLAVDPRNVNQLAWGGSARAARSPMSRPNARRIAQIAETRQAAARIPAEVGEIQGIAGAAIGIRLLHS